MIIHIPKRENRKREDIDLKFRFNNNNIFVSLKLS